ncbi:MAG: alkaline phosphatase D family protein [Burkholderiales bacterium]|nr:alkaline phosphatase D family protein [Burkholderiales bacterium]
MADPGTRPNARRSAGLAPALCTAALLCLAPAPGPVLAADLVAGPMAGHRDARSTLIWLQADGPASARIEYWPEGGGRRKATAAVRLEAGAQFAAQIAVDGLAPGTTYQYRVLLDAREARLPQTPAFRTEGLWQWRNHSYNPALGHQPRDFRVAFGSCAYVNDPPFDRSIRPGGPYGGGYGIFDRIAQARPDLMLWLGDNTYLREADYGSPGAIAARYRRDRAHPSLQALLRTGHHYAIWDDHDFGPNDANASFTYKAEALEVFRRYWPNGAGGMPGTPGIFRVVSHYDVDFFLLDTRFHRDADAAQGLEHKSMLGAAQLRWLKNALIASTANFRVIVAGGQMLKTVPAKVEGWSHFAEERRAFLEWLADNRVPGVLFLSGDRHHTVLTRLPREDAYPLFDFTCSPLTAGAHAPRAAEDMALAEPGTLVARRNFCTIDVGGPWGERTLTLRAHDGDGHELWKRELGARELRYVR